MNKNTLILFSFSLFLVASCKNINVYEKYHNSVVMIYHKYVYKISLNSGEVYFNYNESTNVIDNIKTNLEEAQLNAMGSYGTGFFVDNEGRIATNRHVVNDWTDNHQDAVKGFFRSTYQNLRQENYHIYDSLNTLTVYWEQMYTSTYDEYYKDVYLTKFRDCKALRDEAYNEVQTYDNVINRLSEAKFTVETIYLGFAMDGAFCKKESDFKECQLINISKDGDIDLAIIQSNERKLPDGVLDYIRIPENNVELNVDDEVSMLGYNLGPAISATKTGLQVQKTGGKISQKSNGFRILYSINALQGSSGSPVFSKDGDLVAINYLGYGKESFNYGILAKHLRNLLNK